MKRCPDCEFVYEDDQVLCDMDGKELVRESRWFPLPRTTATEPPPPAKSRWRSLVLLVLAGAILAGVLCVDYYNLKHPTRSHRVSSESGMASPRPETPAIKSETGTPLIEKSDPDSVVNPPALAPASRRLKREASETATPSPSKSSSESEASKSAPPTAKSTGSNGPAEIARPRAAVFSAPPNESRASLVKTADNRPKVAIADQKPTIPSQKKSKLGSFLKKTKQILRKPFKF
jgi:hypothetical protein